MIYDQDVKESVAYEKRDIKDEINVLRRCIQESTRRKDECKRHLDFLVGELHYKLDEYKTVKMELEALIVEFNDTAKKWHNVKDDIADHQHWLRVATEQYNAICKFEELILSD